MNNSPRRPQPLAETDLHYRQSLIAFFGLLTVLLTVAGISLMLGAAMWPTAVAVGSIPTAVGAFFLTLRSIGRKK